MFFETIFLFDQLFKGGMVVSEAVKLSLFNSAELFLHFFKFLVF